MGELLDAVANILLSRRDENAGQTCGHGIVTPATRSSHDLVAERRSCGWRSSGG